MLYCYAYLIKHYPYLYIVFPVLYMSRLVWPLWFNTQHLFEMDSWSRTRLESHIPTSCFRSHHFWFKVLDNESIPQIPPNFPQSNDYFLTTFPSICQVRPLSLTFFLTKNNDHHLTFISKWYFLENRRKVELWGLRLWSVAAIFLIEEMPTISSFFSCFPCLSFIHDKITVLNFFLPI